MSTKHYCIAVMLVLWSFTNANCQQPEQTIAAIHGQLDNGTTTISKVLSDPAYVQLHSLTPFRELIRDHATAETLTMITPNEPGVKATIKGIIKDASGKPLTDKLVYVYHTSTEGWYSDTAPHVAQNQGDRMHARLFAYFKTDAAGAFEFHTIRPNGYPNSDLPAHIHIEITVDDDNSFISELLFDDDPRLVGAIRSRSVNEHFLIEKNKGTATSSLYVYNIEVP